MKAHGKSATQSEIVDSDNLEGGDIDDETDGEPGKFSIHIAVQVLNSRTFHKPLTSRRQHLFFVVAFEDNVRKMVC